MKTLDTVNRKIFDARVDWSAIDITLARKDTQVLDLVREACLVESYLPIFTSRMNELFWDDVAATSVFTIEGFEAYGHYFILRKYLDVVGYQPVTDEDVVALRRRDRQRRYTDKVRELVNFMGTEHFAAEFFSDLVSLTEEPVLKKTLPRFAAEEVNHSRFAFDLLAAMVKNDPQVKSRIHQAAAEFKHVGAYVLPKVSPAKEDNLEIIQGFNQLIEDLTGQPLSESLNK